MKYKQPAHYSYYLQQGFIDMKNVIVGSFTESNKVLQNCKIGIKKSFQMILNAFKYRKLLGFVFAIPGFILLFFYLFQLIFCSIITPIICFNISIFQVSILFCLYSVASVIFGFTIFADNVYCWIHAISNHCPVCQHKFSLPAYYCHCGLKHDQLRPGKYGIFNRKCNCGTIIPTTFFNGRHKLHASCPHCDNIINSTTIKASWSIPVIGGPSSGKTCYIMTTMMFLEAQAMNKYDLKFVYQNNGFDEYLANVKLMNEFTPPPKTADKRLRYYQFSLTPKDAIEQHISLCDVAGELFDIDASGKDIIKQIGFRYANGFIFILDPLAITKFREELETKHNLTGYNGSNKPIDELADILIASLQNIFSIKANDLLESSVAVVFTKMDLPGLDSMIGDNALIKMGAFNDPKIRYKTQNEICQSFLKKYNEHSFVNIISQFKNVQYFTCSTLGHNVNGKRFFPKNVEAPFLWLITKTSKVIDRAIKNKNNLG